MSDLADLEQKFQFGPVAKFDFDIRNYDVNDMMNILNISGNPSKLNHFNVKEKTNAIIEKVNSDENLSSEMRNKFVSFIQALEFFLIYKYNVKADNYVMGKKLLDPNKLIADVAVRKNDGSYGGGGGGGGGNGGGDMVSINTYRRNIIPRLLSFDTKFRPNYFSTSSANFSMVLPTPLKNVISMRLISFEFPNVVYDIDATLGTNMLNIKDHNGNNCNYELPSGNYHSDTVCNALNEISGNILSHLDNLSFNNADDEIYKIKLTPSIQNSYPAGTKVMISLSSDTNSNSPSTEFDLRKDVENGNELFITVPRLGRDTDIINGLNSPTQIYITINEEEYTQNGIADSLGVNYKDADTKFDNFFFCIDTKTGRCIITSSSKKAFELDFTNTLSPGIPITKNLGWKLGFRQLKYQGLFSYISEAPVDLGGQKVIFFCVDDYRTNVTENVSIVYQNSFMNRNILARIPLRQGKFVTCYDDNSDMIRKKRDYFGPVTIDKLHFRLLDEYGIDVRLNYSDYSFGLEFEILYEK